MLLEINSAAEKTLAMFVKLLYFELFALPSSGFHSADCKHQLVQIITVCFFSRINGYIGFACTITQTYWRLVTVVSITLEHSSLQ